jgi:hypothetical protein
MSHPFICIRPDCPFITKDLLERWTITQAMVEHPAPIDVRILHAASIMERDERSNVGSIVLDD